MFAGDVTHRMGIQYFPETQVCWAPILLHHSLNMPCLISYGTDPSTYHRAFIFWTYSIYFTVQQSTHV